MEVIGGDLKGSEVVIGNFFGFDFIIEVVLADDSDGSGLELHIDVFGDQDGWGLVVLHQEQAGRKDAVVNASLVWEYAVEAIEGSRVFGAC